MNTFDEIRQRLAVPLIAAPMFLVSGPELVIAASAAGVIGAFPTVNARTSEELAEWLARIEVELAGVSAPHGRRPAPVAPNLIVHHSNTRLNADLLVLQNAAVELVITSVGSPANVVGPLHESGALVFADVASIRHAHRAVEAGADGLILLTAGAGGQTGWANPFAFVRAVREFFSGPLVLAGGISDGVALRAAITLGADLAYMGTKFIATKESMAASAHKRMLTSSSLDQVMLTSAFTGLPTSMLEASVSAVGVDSAALRATGTADMTNLLGRSQTWKNLYSAGHSVSGVDTVLPVAELVERTRSEYQDGWDNPEELRPRTGSRRTVFDSNRVSAPITTGGAPRS